MSKPCWLQKYSMTFRTVKILYTRTEKRRRMKELRGKLQLEQHTLTLFTVPLLFPAGRSSSIPIQVPTRNWRHQRDKKDYDDVINQKFVSQRTFITCVSPLNLTVPRSPLLSPFAITTRSSFCSYNILALVFLFLSH